MKGLIAVAAAGEAATGLALLLLPSTVGQMLLGTELAGAAAAVARVAGIALIALAIACCPGPPRLGMLVYSTAVAAFLAYLGLSGAARGGLLWPAVGLHLILSALLARESLDQRRAGARTDT
jgi:hypothetical protein